MQSNRLKLSTATAPLKGTVPSWVRLNSVLPRPLGATLLMASSMSSAVTRSGSHSTEADLAAEHGLLSSEVGNGEDGHEGLILYLKK